MTKYGVYIIEFLRTDDYTDGENLHEILKLSLVPTIYKWVDTKSELKAALNDFNKSKYRYLHVSCHAEETGFELNGDDLTNYDFEQLTKTLLKDKRIFLSACKGANRDIATRMVVNNKAYSLIGVPIDLDFDKSALFWPSFYHLLNEIDSNKMKRDQIVDVYPPGQVPVQGHSVRNKSKRIMIVIWEAIPPPDSRDVMEEQPGWI